MNAQDMNEFEFSQLSDSQQHLTMFKNQCEVIDLLRTTNGKVRRHEKELNALKVLGFGVLAWMGISLKIGIPFIPGL